MNDQTFGQSRLQDFWADIQTKYGINLSGQVHQVGEADWLNRVASHIVHYFFKECIDNFRMMAILIAISLFGLFLETLHSVFERKMTQFITTLAIQFIAMVVMLQAFHETIQYAKTSIDTMIQFMQAMLPIYMTMMASMGNVVTVTILHPIMVFFIQFLGQLIRHFIFPLFYFSTVLYFVTSLTDRYNLSLLAGLLRKTGIVLLGIVISIFIGVSAAQGAGGAIMDGVALKATKFLIGNFVPVVGRMFSEATDAAMGASLLVKNTMGLSGLLILVIYCVFPAIKIAAVSFSYLIVSALLQPLGPSKMLTPVQMVGKNLIYVCVSVLAVGFLFFFAMTILIVAGNWTYLYR